MAEVLEEGWVDARVHAEFPDLRLRWLVADARPGRSSPDLQARLRLLSDRFTGAQAIAMRRTPVPQAYRVFFRGIGLDPDTTRTPIEAAALDRLFSGGFVASDVIADALLLALVETGVPLWAVDDAALDGPLGIREARAGERLGTTEHAHEVPPGRLLVTDAEAPVAVLFGDVVPSHRPHARTRRIRVFSLQVAGVPEIHVEEALWLCAEALHAAGDPR